jgi:hypothetical protein
MMKRKTLLWLFSWRGRGFKGMKSGRRKESKKVCGRGRGGKKGLVRKTCSVASPAY